MKSRLAQTGGLLFLFFALTFFSGFSIFPYFKQKPRVFPLPGNYNEVWNATLEVLREEEIPILKADKSSGYIQTKPFPLFKKEYRAWAKKPFLSGAGYCRLEIGVVNQNPSLTALGIKAFFQRRHGFYFLGYRKRDASRGVFEKLIAGRVNDRLIKQKFPRLQNTVIGCRLRYDESLSRYVVREAEPGGLGYEQGLLDGDVLLKIDGEDVHPGNLFSFLLTGEGETVRTFRVKRKRKELEIPVSIFSLKSDTPVLGFSVSRDPQTGRFKVSEVAENSPAQKAGIQTGDFLIQENEIPLDSWKNYYRALLAAKRGKPKTFLIERENLSLEVVIN